MLEIKRLERDEIEKVYHEHLVFDFIKEEQKPFEYLMVCYEKGFYEGLGLFEEERLIGYSFLASTAKKDTFLMDYFAVCREFRCRGYGSEFLRMLQLFYAKERMIFFEVESGEHAVTMEEKKDCERRIAFYLKNGLVKTSNTCLLFGIPMKILYLPLKDDDGIKITDRIVYEELDKVYHTMFNEQLYERVKLEFHES